MMKISELLSQKRTVYSLLVFGVVALMTLNFWGYFFLRNLEVQLLQQLKEQVQTNGDLYGLQLSNEFQSSDFYELLDDDIRLIQLQRILFDFKERGKLANIFLSALDKQQAIDYDFRRGNALPADQFQISDSLFSQALLQQTTQVELRSLGGLYFLTAYVPVKNIFEETLAVLVFDVPARFFSQIEKFRTLLFWVGMGSSVGILGFTLLIIVAVRRIFAIEDQLHQHTRLAQLGQMAAMVAHEIRNPLSIIKGTADVLRKKYANEQNEMFEFIPDEIDRLNRLVNDFLQFARERELKITETNIAELLTKIVDRFHDSRIHCEIPDGLPSIQADSDALTQVLLNVIENARKAIQEDGIIRIGAKHHAARPQRIEIWVSDNGCGMNKDTLKRLFEPFFSTRATGSGLGMAISRQLVEQMNGTISVQSAPGNGTDVFITFPIKDGL